MIGAVAGTPAAASALGIAGGQAAGGLFSFGLGQMASSKAWDKWKDSQTRGPLYRMIGLEQAGLNPILAAKGALGAAGGNPVPPVASGGATNFSGAQAVETMLKANARLYATQADSNAAAALSQRTRARVEEKRLQFWKDNPDVWRDLMINESLPNSLEAMIAKAFLGGDKDWGDLGSPPGYREAVEFISNAKETARQGREQADARIQAVKDAGGRFKKWVTDSLDGVREHVTTPSGKRETRHPRQSMHERGRRNGKRR